MPTDRPSAIRSLAAGLKALHLTPHMLAQRAGVSWAEADRALRGDLPAFDRWQAVVRALKGNPSIPLGGTYLSVAPPKAIRWYPSLRRLARELWELQGRPAQHELASASGLNPGQVRQVLGTGSDGHLELVHRLLTAANLKLFVSSADRLFELQPFPLVAETRPRKRHRRRRKAPPKPRRHRRRGRVDPERVRLAHQAGLTWPEIARAFEVTLQRVHQLRSFLGILPVRVQRRLDQAAASRRGRRTRRRTT